jgi:N-acyl homoserine lactone hydrolase
MILHGRPATLHILNLGTFAVGAGRVIGIPAYLLTTDRGERVLVDTGFPDAYGELAMLGLAPSDIDLLVLTHSHIDHIGGLSHFTHVPIVIGAAERALPRPLYWAGHQPMAWPQAEWRAVHEDTDIGPHLTILHVPGHTPGQLALRFDLPHTGRIVLTSDAISRPSEPDEGFDDAHDPVQARASAARLLAMPADLCNWGHCPLQWQSLQKSPDYYT